jgi:hypothetical protein
MASTNPYIAAPADLDTDTNEENRPWKTPTSFLDLPVELRLQIYEVVKFNRPIKRRTMIGYPPLASILRANRQTYEAIDTLFANSTFVFTRKDFCTRAEALGSHTIKRPAPPTNFLRHVIISNFDESTVCSPFSDNTQCSTCQTEAFGFLRALEAMPLLRTIMVDVHRSPAQFEDFFNTFAAGQCDLELLCTEFGRYQLTGPALEGKDIKFEFRPLVRIFELLQSMKMHDPPLSRRDMDRTHAETRAIEAAGSSRGAWELFSTHQCQEALVGGLGSDLDPLAKWRADALRIGPKERSISLHSLTREIVYVVRRFSV